MKKLLTYALLVLAIAGISVAVVRQIHPSEKALAAVGENPEPARALAQVADTLPSDGVVVTYFTSDVRCPSCFKIEALARQTVEQDFVEDMRAGRLLFRSVNVDQPANKHFVEEYQLVSKTVVVSSRQGGQETNWANLQEVWFKLGDEAGFARYIGDEVRKQPGHAP